MSKRILFFGNEQLATGTAPRLAIISKLLELDYQITSIVISQANYQDSKRVLDTTSMEQFAVPQILEAATGADNQQPQSE